MNKKDLLIKRNNAVREIRHSNKIGSHRNCIRISGANSLEHEITKLKICYNLLKESKEFITEAIFDNGSRADILILDDHKIIEILYSEKEIECIRKARKYPTLFELEMVKADGETKIIKDHSQEQKSVIKKEKK